MGYNIDNTASECLLPNEEALHRIIIDSGYAFLTDRRFVIVFKNKLGKPTIQTAIPLDCVREVNLTTDNKAALVLVQTDRNGNLTTTRTEFHLKAPSPMKGESMSDIVDAFHRSVQHTSDRLNMNKNRGINNGMPPPRNYDYLKELPDYLTHNAILDLNVILQDTPIHDHLHNEIERYLGSDPFILEESLRDGNDVDNGVLFAAGIQGFIWIQGNKSGRYMSDILVDKFEWENIIILDYRWNSQISDMELLFYLQKGHSIKSSTFWWKPTVLGKIDGFEWLFQEKNGPWILADLMYKYSGKPMPASRNDVDTSTQRFYY